MLLNRIEFALMNNPLRAALQRHVEARRLLRMGGRMSGGRALELGCGRGIGVGVILDLFGADRVDAFDLDRRMVARARRRLRDRSSKVRLLIADASAIPAADRVYDAVFDFGIIHHVPNWRAAVGEVERVLKPGGMFYAEEALSPIVGHPVVRRILDHPLTDRFDALEFRAAMEEVGLVLHECKTFLDAFGWFTARKGRGAGGN